MSIGFEWAPFEPETARLPTFSVEPNRRTWTRGGMRNDTMTCTSRTRSFGFGSLSDLAISYGFDPVRRFPWFLLVPEREGSRFERSNVSSYGTLPPFHNWEEWIPQDHGNEGKTRAAFVLEMAGGEDLRSSSIRRGAGCMDRHSHENRHTRPTSRRRRTHGSNTFGPTAPIAKGRPRDASRCIATSSKPSIRTVLRTCTRARGFP